MERSKIPLCEERAFLVRLVDVWSLRMTDIVCCARTQYEDTDSDDEGLTMKSPTLSFASSSS